MAATGQDVTEFAAGAAGLRILHVMRSPVGGLFRHVVDLAGAQARAGHSVGIVADSLTGGGEASRILDDLSPSLALGVTRFPMHRMPHPEDLWIAWRVARLVREQAPDVLHGHGAKGGLYARVPALLPGFPKPDRTLVRTYTPHGGTLHFRPDTALGKIFFAAERIMGGVTDFIPFESDYARRRFFETIGRPRAIAPVIHNGVCAREFEAITAGSDAADFVFIGEMRVAKGVEDLLRAFATLPDHLTLALVGSGRDDAAFRDLAQRLGLSDRVHFLTRMPAQEALGRGRILVLPSRAESLPYVILEAFAHKVPVVATNIGGVPEIFGAHAAQLAPAGDPPALAQAMRRMLDMSPDARERLAREMSDFVKERFTIELMHDGVLQGYRQALASARDARSVAVAS